MLLVFPIIQLVTLLACLPAYRTARERQEEPVWSLFLVAPCLLVWIAMTMAGVGAQSFSNLVELFDLMLGTVILYYLKVFMMDRVNQSPVLNNFIVIMITVMAAVLLRMYMPLLPE